MLPHTGLIVEQSKEQCCLPSLSDPHDSWQMMLSGLQHCALMMMVSCVAASVSIVPHSVRTVKTVQTITHTINVVYCVCDGLHCVCVQHMYTVYIYTTCMYAIHYVCCVGFTTVLCSAGNNCCVFSCLYSFLARA